MDLTSSTKNKIFSNYFLNDDLFVYDSYKNNIFKNTVDEKPLIYLEDESDIKIDDTTGQIILVNCENISILNQNISGIVHGIELWNCNSCDISKSTLTDNHFALTLYYCSNNLISENNISNNIYGIVLDSSNNISTVISNDIINNDYGISIYGVNYSTFITDNKFSNNLFGIQVYKSNNSIISNNTFSNEYVGVYILFISNNNSIFSNVFIDCGDGIWIHLANDNRVYKNKIMVSEVDGIGIWLLQSYYNKVLNNTITDCFISIQLFYSYYNIVSDNYCYKGGLAILYSFQNTIISNFVNIKPIVYLEDESDENVNEAGQIFLVNCTNIKVQNLNLSNAFFGVVLWDSNACYISNNTLSYNYHGIYTTDSHNNSISGNKISNYIYHGINCYKSNENTFSNNDVWLENKIFKGPEFYHKKSIHLKNSLNNNFQKLHSYLDSISTDAIIDFCLFCINPYIHQKDISTNESNGMLFNSCNINIISENNIRNNIEGIVFEKSNLNIIRKNNIEKNDRGIFLDNSLQNDIIQNNFIKNKKHAFFVNCKNTWKENFWNRLRFFPKLIFGENEILERSIPWVNIDWRPVNKAYNI
jgi:parallel beta-helix repeat protein